jgi:hypothetical protein
MSKTQYYSRLSGLQNAGLSTLEMERHGLPITGFTTIEER